MSGSVSLQVSSLSSLPTPQFVTDSDGLDPIAVLNDTIAAFQQASGRTLYPAQPERLLINLYAYREILVRNAIQQTGLQNLLAFASYPAIDYLGQLVGVSRLPAQPATTTLQFTLTNSLTSAFTIPAGTQVGTNDGAFVFATDAALTIPPGTLSGTITATCQTPGSGGNGYLPGQITILIGGNAFIASVSNTTTSSGGAEPETDDHLRSRIQQAPNQFSNAGPSGAYRYWALSANPTIQDVQVVSPAPGQVSLYILTGPITAQPASAPNPAGIPSAAVLQSVTSLVNGETVRPLTDTVSVNPVTEVDYVVNATITYYANASLTSVQSLVQQAAQALMLTLANQIGQDLVPSQWIASLSVQGVYEVAVSFQVSINGQNQPLQPDGRYVMQPGQWANCTAFNPTYIQGTANMPS